MATTQNKEKGSDPKPSAAAFEETARRYQFIADIFKESVTLIDRRYTYQDANETYCKAQAKKREHIIGLSVRDMWGEEVFTNIIKVYLDRCFQGEEARDEAWFEFPRTGMRCFNTIYYPYRDAGGAVTHAVVVSRDVTAHKNLTEELRQAQKMEIVGRLVAGVSHDFKNILTVIIGYSEMGLTKLPKTDSTWEDLEEIRKAGERAKRLTNQLLAFSRRQVMKPKVLNLNEHLDDMNKMIAQILGPRVNLEIRPKADLWPIKADPGHLEQVIMNLAVNARDAMNESGSFTLSTENVTLDEAFVKSHADVKPGDYVLLSASDTGCGMSEEVKKRIFEAFFTTKGVGKGTGLGLATCSGIVKDSGGCIAVESEIGKGTTFQVYLPRAEALKEEAGAEGDIRKAPRGAETILWVEEDAGLRGFIGRALRELGYQVLEASDGGGALNLMQEHRGKKVSLLITDVLLPMVSGAVLAERIKMDRPEIKTLFTSGLSEEGLAKEGIVKPASEILKKPFWPITLAIKIREVLDAASEVH